MDNNILPGDLSFVDERDRVLIPKDNAIRTILDMRCLLLMKKASLLYHMEYKKPWIDEIDVKRGNHSNSASQHLVSLLNDNKLQKELVESYSAFTTLTPQGFRDACPFFIRLSASVFYKFLRKIFSIENIEVRPRFSFDTRYSLCSSVGSHESLCKTEWIYSKYVGKDISPSDVTTILLYIICATIRLNNYQEYFTICLPEKCKPIINDVFLDLLDFFIDWVRFGICDNRYKIL